MMSRNKKIIYLTLSAIFLTLSAVGIGWLMKQEIEKGKQENQKQSSAILRRENPVERKYKNDGVDAEIVVENKDQANKILDDVEGLMNLMEKDDLAESQVNK